MCGVRRPTWVPTEEGGPGLLEGRMGGSQEIRGSMTAAHTGKPVTLPVVSKVRGHGGNVVGQLPRGLSLATAPTAASSPSTGASET